MLCYRCGHNPRRPNDSYCVECRNDYVRIWKAKKRHGKNLNGYAPRIVTRNALKMARTMKEII